MSVDLGVGFAKAGDQFDLILRGRGNALVLRANGFITYQRATPATITSGYLLESCYKAK
jgi:hypothetical protein